MLGLHQRLDTIAHDERNPRYILGIQIKLERKSPPYVNNLFSDPNGREALTKYVVEARDKTWGPDRNGYAARLRDQSRRKVEIINAKQRKLRRDSQSARDAPTQSSDRRVKEVEQSAKQSSVSSAFRKGQAKGKRQRTQAAEEMAERVVGRGEET